jgi:alpha-L-fucosidase
MGNWLKINGNAIYGTRYWKESDQKEGHLAFTTKGNSLFAIALEKPTKPFVVHGTKGWTKTNIKSVELLGATDKVLWEMTKEGVKITPPKSLGKSQYAWSFKILTDSNQYHPNVIEIDANKVFKGTKKVDVNGF